MVRILEVKELNQHDFFTDEDYITRIVYEYQEDNNKYDSVVVVTNEFDTSMIITLHDRKDVTTYPIYSHSVDMKDDNIYIVDVPKKMDVYVCERISKDIVLYKFDDNRYLFNNVVYNYNVYVEVKEDCIVSVAFKGTLKTGIDKVVSREVDNIENEFDEKKTKKLVSEIMVYFLLKEYAEFFYFYQFGDKIILANNKLPYNSSAITLTNTTRDEIDNVFVAMILLDIDVKGFELAEVDKKTVRAFKRENEDGSIDVLVVKRNFSQETIQEVDGIKLNFFKLHFPANKKKV